MLKAFIGGVLKAGLGERMLVAGIFGGLASAFTVFAKSLAKADLELEKMEKKETKEDDIVETKEEGA